MMLINSFVTTLIVSWLLLVSTIDAFQISSERRNVVVPIEIATTITNHPLDESPVMLPSNTIGTNLPPVIQQIANERAEFQINLGRAMDTLRKDMPYILSQTPGNVHQITFLLLHYTAKV